jgi:aryl-alcohol dehydrogenase-like predicted oxidoreductase
MEKRPLGNTGILVSSMALGTMYFNTTVDGNTSIDIMDAYVNAGGQFVDTANMYASWLDGFTGGESEIIIGKWMVERRNRKDIFLSTKVGLPMKDVPESLNAELIINECENSLRRLQTDYIDLYFAHREDPATPVDETLEAFNKLVKQGKVRFLGVSNHATWRVVEANLIAEMNGWVDFCCAQYKFTYIRPRHGTRFDPQMAASEDLLEYCHQRGMGIMAYSPLMGGSYGNPDVPLWEQYTSADTNARVKAIRELAEALQVSVNQLVLAWLMQGKYKIIPLITSENPAQILENIDAGSIVLPEDQIHYLANISA